MRILYKWLLREATSSMIRPINDEIYLEILILDTKPLLLVLVPKNKENVAKNKIKKMFDKVREMDQLEMSNWRIVVRHGH
jgi:hypothetical protein